MPNKTYDKVQLRVKFTQASDRANIGNSDTNGENIAISFGKLSKWYEALVPTGGSSGKILAWNTAGTAKWSDPLHPTITKSADTTSTASPTHGGTFTVVDSVTREANGHVTKINTKTITLPADSNTDTKVTQSETTTTNYRPIIFGAKNSSTVSELSQTVTDQTYTTSNMYAQPSTGTIFASLFNGVIYKSGGSWITARDNAPVYANKGASTGSSYYPAFFAKSKTGGWSMGVLGNSDTLYTTFTTDENYSANPQSNTNTYQIAFPSKNGTIALTSDLSGYLPLAGGTLTGRVTTTKCLNYLVTGSGTAGVDKGSGANPRYVPAKWTFNTDQTVSDGDIIFVKIPVAGHDYGVYMSIDNGSHYYPIVTQGSSRLTTHYGNGNYAAFIFRSGGSASSMIPLAGNTDGSRVTVSGGVWQAVDYYDSGNNYDRTSQQTRIYAGGVGVFRYSLCAMNNSQRMESFTTTGDANGSPTTTKTFNTSAHFMYPPVIMFNAANGVYSNGTAIGNNVLYEQYPSLDLRYSCNKTSSSGFAQYKPLYIECTLNSDNTFSITTNGLTQTFATGKYYILLGCMYNTSVYQLALFAQHPMFYYDGTNLNGIVFSAEEKTKLAGISSGANKTESSTNGKIKIDGTDTTVYTHPSYTSKTSGLYKITVDSTGHISGTASVSPSDIPDLNYVPNTQAGVNAAINLLSTGSSTPTDADYYISQYVGGDTTTTTYHRRPMSALWSYVKGKADSVYLPIGHTYSLSIAADSGTNQLTLSASTKYKLTAGGSTFVFTTSPDTTYSAGNHLSLSSTTFSIASYCKSITDWNSATTNGWYMGSSVTNAPSTEWWFGRVIAHNNKYCMQEIWQFTRSTDGHKVPHKMRMFVNNVWGNWVDVTVGTQVPENAVFTDTKVTQTLSSDANLYPMLMSTDTNSSPASAITSTSLRNNSIAANPSNGLISCAGRYIKYFAIQTGSSKQQKISFQTLFTWLKDTKKYIPDNKYCHIVLAITWSYADNDILQLQVGTSNYELQLAGTIIEFMGYATSYNEGMFRLLIHSSPTTSFTPTSGYTAFPVSTIAEYTCNGSAYAPTWKKIWNSHPSYTSKSSGLYKITVDGTGHVSATTAVVKADITALGIPGSDTKYGISGAYGANSNTWVTTITAGGTGTTSTVPTASTSAYGITKLYNGVDSTSTGLAATANAVKTAYDKANHTHPYLPKTTYEWNKEISFGNSGYLKIGSFPMYDTNITIDINATTSETYHGTVVIATQNVSTTSMGSHKIHVYDDPTGNIATSLRIVWTSGSRNYDIYFIPQSWSKNFIHIRALGNYMDGATDICVSQTGTAPATTSGLEPVNILSVTSTGNGNAVTKVEIDSVGNLAVTKGTTFSTTDEKVKATKIAQSTAEAIYYPTLVSGAGTAGVGIFDSARINHTPGTTSVVGNTRLILGNATASGTANNEEGLLKLYSPGTSYHTLKGASTSSIVEHTLPTTGGTILNDVTTSFTQTLSSGTKIGTIKINGTSTDLYCQTNTNTDTKVTQSETTTANYRPIVFGATNSTDTSTLAATITDQAYVSTLLYAQPQNGILYANRMYLKAPGSKGQLNLLTSKYNVMLRNDDSNTYFLVTAQNDPTGTWTSARPLTINNSTGVCNINGNAATATNANNANNANNVNTTVTNGSTSNVSYGITYVADPNTSESNVVRKTNDFRISLKNGTAGTGGSAELVLGNNKNTSTADNKEGCISLYSSNTSYHTLKVESTTSPVIHTFPATAGTVLNDGTTSFTQSLTSGTKIGTIKINGTSTDLYCQTNTDTKVTSSANHYTPATASGQDKTASASGATAAWSIDVVKGVTLNTDGKGHVTGISVTSGKIPGNPNTDRYVNTASFTDDSTNTAASPVKMTLTRAGSDTATVTANIPKVSSSSAGVAPKGAAVSTQSQSTKFLREDGSWAAPSYTSIPSGNVTGTGLTADKVILGNGNSTIKTSGKGITDNSSTTAVTSTDTNLITARTLYYAGYLPLSGGTMTGKLTAKASQYPDEYDGALNMNNSNIYGVNSIYTADASDNAAEGIHFYRDSTHVDTLWMNGGSLLFVPNRELGTSTTAANSQKVARFTANPTTGQVVITDGTTGGVKSSGYTIATSVPSGAVFTDTKNTAGSTDTSSKIYLVGATSQAANPQTYSDNEVYTTSGVLTTKKVQVGGGSCTMEYNSTTQSLDFVFV